MVVGISGTNANIPVSGINVSRPKDVQEEAILLDPVYSGKAAAGLIDLVRKGVSLAILGCTELGIIASDLPLHYIDAAEVLAKEVVAVAKDQKAPHVSDM